MSIAAVSTATTSFYDALKTSSSNQVDNTSSNLSKTDFLEMMITKLENQDPLNVDDSDFTSQLAQYSSLEQMQNMNDSITAMGDKLTDLNTNSVSQMLLTNTAQAVSLVGKTVSVSTTDSTTSVVTTATGTVSTVKFVDGVPKIVVNGIEYELSDVTEVAA